MSKRRTKLSHTPTDRRHVGSNRSTARGHERRGSRKHGAGATGRINRGVGMPGPGHYGDPWAAYNARQRTMTQYVGPTQPPAPSVRDRPLPGVVGRIPRGFTFGAPKTGPLTGVDQHMTGMGKGNASRQAALYAGEGVAVGKAPVLSTVAAAPALSFGKPPPAAGQRWSEAGGDGAEMQGKAAGRGVGGVVWGQFARVQGEGHLPYTTPTHPPGPGPDTYQVCNVRGGRGRERRGEGAREAGGALIDSELLES
jgi:hypothetical protein